MPLEIYTLLRYATPVGNNISLNSDALNLFSNTKAVKPYTEYILLMVI